MSTPAVVALILLASFACVFGLCEWMARRLHRSAREAREKTPQVKVPHWSDHQENRPC